MTKPLPFSARLVHAWVWLYTRGLATELRRARHDEIDSDLWEHVHETKGAGRVGVNLQVLARLLLGLAADVAWRLETGATRRAGKERGMSASFLSTRMTGGGRAEKVFLACAGLLVVYQAAIALISAGFGVGLWRGGPDDPGNGWFLTLPISAAGVVLILAGLKARAAAPFRGGVLVTLGVLPSIGMFWMMIPPVIALGVAIYAVLDGGSRQKRIDAGR
jgi:hypothetical protein